MDRQYKAKHSVSVFTDTEAAKKWVALGTFRQAPYSLNGFDNYLFKGVMYKGYHNELVGTYIMLSEPLAITGQAQVNINQAISDPNT